MSTTIAEHIKQAPEHIHREDISVTRYCGAACFGDDRTRAQIGTGFNGTIHLDRNGAKELVKALRGVFGRL